MCKENRTAKDLMDDCLEDASVCLDIKGLSKDEKILAEILYFFRNYPKNLEYCKKNQIYPAPKGKKCLLLDNKKVVWMPEPSEACDIQLFHGLEWDSNTKKYKNYSPFLYYKHCKSRCHCQYLVRYRTKYVFGLFRESSILFSLVSKISQGLIPTLINVEREWVKDLIFEVLCGKSIDLNRNLLTNSVEYKDIPIHT